MKNERKEELKDEMKNRISLALKDPILQQGFEIICKENAELKYQLEHRNCLDCSNHSSKLKMRTLELEKENAELKRQLNKNPCVKKDYYCSDCLKDIDKAKEIIKELYEGLDKLYLSGLSVKQIAFIEHLQDKVEQFLNSEVER